MNIRTVEKALIVISCVRKVSVPAKKIANGLQSRIRQQRRGSDGNKRSLFVESNLSGWQVWRGGTMEWDDEFTDVDGVRDQTLAGVTYCLSGRYWETRHFATMCAESTAGNLLHTAFQLKA